MKPMNNSPTMTAPSKTKIGVKLITIDRAEGLPAECFKSTHETWASAENRIKVICASSPKNGTYSKCDFKIEYIDGESYEDGRFDAQHPEAKNREASLGDHVRNFLTFRAGLRCPSHMTEADYEEYLRRTAEVSPGAKDQALHFLKTYALTDEEAGPITTDSYLPVVGNTAPMKGLLKLMGGKLDGDVWMVPAEAHKDAQAAVDRFTKVAEPKAKTITAPIATPILPAPRQTSPAPQQAPRTKKGTKGSRLPPTALIRRLEAILTGAQAIHASSEGGVRSEFHFIIEHITKAIEAEKEKGTK